MKPYLIKIAVFVALMSLPLLISSTYAFWSGEYRSLNKIVDQQLGSQEACLYGTAFHDDIYAYKKTLLERKDTTDVIVLGSSRVLQFRQHAFSGPFINLGRAMTSIAEGYSLTKEIIKEKPSYIIIGVDFWWFNPSIDETIPQSNPGRNSYIYDAWNIIRWTATGKITASEISGQIKENSCDTGIMAKEKDGFAKDGSYYYTRTVTGQRPTPDAGFADTLRRIEKGERFFEHNVILDKKRFDNFIKLVDIFEAAGVKVIVFMPPLSQTALTEMEKTGHYKYINELKNWFEKSEINFIDYTDATKISSPDCEFIDGFHGGDVTYARILRDIGKRYPLLQRHISKTIDKDITDNKGHTFMKDPGITNNPEVDFLNLGCKKN